MQVCCFGTKNKGATKRQQKRREKDWINWKKTEKQRQQKSE
jgi:hypothetical protein